MAVTIGLGPSAGQSGAGQSGIPAGLEAFMAQAGGAAAEGVQDGSSSDLAANPFMAQLAAALQALQSGSAEDLQAAALALAGQEGQILQNQALQTVVQNAAGQDLPLDPSFSSAVMATFAAVQEMIRQHGVSEIQANGEQAGELTQIGLEDPSAILDQMASDQAAAADSSSDPSALVAALAASSAALAQTPVNATSLSGKQTEASTPNIEAVSGAGATTNPADQAAMQTLIEQGLDSTQAVLNAEAKTAVDPGVQTVLNRLQSANTEKKIVTTVIVNPAKDASAEQLAQRLALDSGADLESSAHALEQAAGNASMVRHIEQTALMQQGLELGIGADASAKAAISRNDAANASQLQNAGASAEARVEAARASLASGPLNVEVLRLTRQGGGRAVLEVTPPNQGPIRLDLQLDGSGRASLIVEGLSEALRTRLEGTVHFLRQDMAQMGLALNLEMRERSDAQAQQAAFGQGGFQSQREAERQSLENSLTSSTGLDSVGKASIATTADKEGGVYLYA